MDNNYSEHIPRVSDLVSHKFPFDGDARNRYLKWLYDSRGRIFGPGGLSATEIKEKAKFNADDPDSYYELQGWLYSKWYIDKLQEVYINEACDVGTFIHLQMEKFILGGKLDEDDILYHHHRGEIEGGIEYYRNLMKEHNVKIN